MLMLRFASFNELRHLIGFIDELFDI